MTNKVVKLAAVTFCIMLLLVSPIQAGLVFNRGSGSRTSGLFRFIQRDTPSQNEPVLSNTPPEVYLLTLDGFITRDSTPGIEYYFTDRESDFGEVKLYINGRLAASKTRVSPGRSTKRISPEFNLDSGSHTYYVTVSDGQETTVSETRTIVYQDQTTVDQTTVNRRDSEETYVLTAEDSDISTEETDSLHSDSSIMSSISITLHEPENDAVLNSKPVTHIYSVQASSTWVSCFLKYGTETKDSRNVRADDREISVDVSPADGEYKWHVRCDDGGSFISSPSRDITIDTTPPGHVTGLTATEITSHSIKWEWNDPTDDDLSHIEIWINNAFKENVSAGTEYYVATGLNPTTDYVIYTYPVDDAGNKGSLIHNTATTFEDTEDPVITYNPNTDESGSYSKDWIMVNVTVDEPHLQTLNLIWNGATESFANSDGDVYWAHKTGLSDGTYTFDVYAEDTSGNNAYAGERTVILDSTPPEAVINLRATSIGETWIFWEWNNPTDPNLDHIEVYLDGLFQENTSNEYFNATGLSPETAYEISVRPVDTAGNMGIYTNDTAETLSVDTLPTIDFVRISPSSPNNNANLVCEFRFQDAESTELPADTTWYRNGAKDNAWDDSFMAQNNTVETSAGPLSSQTSIGETWECEVTISDRDGDVTLLSDPVTISEVPNTPPGVYLVTPDNAYTNDAIPDIEYYFIDNENETADSTLYFNGAPVNTIYNVQNGTETKTISPSAPQSEGSHSYYIEVFDGIETGTSATQTITIDLTDPVISYNLNTDAEGTYDKDWIMVNVTATDDLLLNSVTLEWNGVNETFANSLGDVYWVNKTGPSDGTYTFRAYAEDEAGNIASTSERTVVLEEQQTLPVFDFVRIIPEIPETTDNLICEFRFQDDENESLPADIRWYRNGAKDNAWDDSFMAQNDTLENSTGPTSSQTSSGQVYECEVTLHDVAGDVTLLSDPVTVILPAVTNLDATSVGETWIFWEWDNPTDNEFDHIKVSIDGSAPISIGANEYYNATGLNPGTTYEINVTPYDTLGNAGTSALDTATTLSENNPPVVQFVDLLPNNPGSDEDLSCQFMATDDENETLSADITWYRNGINVNDWDVSGMSITNNTYVNSSIAPAYTDTATGEVWTCEVTVFDEPGASDSGTASETIHEAGGPGGNTLPTINVTTENNTIVITDTPTISFYFTDPEDARGDATVYFNGTGVGSMSDVANNTPTNITISSLPDGLYDFTVEVFDGAGTNSSLTYSMRIDTAQQYVDLFYNDNTDESGSYSKDWIMVNVTARNPDYTSVILEWNGVNETFANSLGDIYWTNKTNNTDGLEEGTYIFRAYADYPGGTDVLSYRTVVLDTTPPNITNVTTDPENVTNDGNEQDIDVDFNSSEYPLEITFNLYDSDSTLVHTQGPENVNGPDELPITYTIPAGLSDGVYTLNMTTVDSAGNSVTVTVMTFIVDTPAPSPGPSGGGGGGGAALPRTGYTGAVLRVTPEEPADMGISPNPGVGLGSDFTGIIVQEGQTRTLIFTVENDGNIPDVYSIYIEGVDWATVDKTRVSLEPGESVDVILILTPQVGDAGDYVIRAVADSQNSPVSSTWDYEVRVTPAGMVTAFIVFAGGAAGAALLGLAFFILIAAVFWRAASPESRERVKSKLGVPDKNGQVKKKVEDEQEFLDKIVKSTEKTPVIPKTQSIPKTQIVPEQTYSSKFDFNQRDDKYIWEV